MKNDSTFIRLYIVSFFFFGAIVAGAENKLNVFTSIPPIAFFVEQIGGDMVKVDSVIDINGNPHSYTPTPKQVVKLGKAKMFFTIGVPFERPLVKQIKSLSTPPLIVDLTKGIKFRKMGGAHEDCADAHNHDHELNGGVNDPHVWLGPEQIKIIAGNITNTMVVKDKANAAKYKANHKLFLKKLKVINVEIAKQLLPCKGETVLVYHPSFGYFTDAFGLKQEAVEIEGKSPSPPQIIKLIREAKKDKIKVIFVQPQFDGNAAANIAKAIKGSVVSMNSNEKNVFENMKKMATKIRR